MVHVIRALLIVLTISVFAECKQKKVSMKGDEPVKVSDFIEAFETLPLPFRLTDSSVNKKEKDSSLISHKIFNQFVPDSIFHKTFDKGITPKVYSIGKIAIDKENYLIVKAVQDKKKVAYLLTFNKDNAFTGAMVLLAPDQNPATQQNSVIEKNFTITKSVQRRNTDGSISDGKDAYVFNNEAKTFMLIMTDALDDKPAEVINPIDTFARKNKFSGDYIKSKTDYVSVRDTRKPGRILFFIHSEKNNGECTAELKGEASLTSPTLAVYRAGGDPCVLQLSFTTSSVSLKEVEGCGSHRGLRCLFEGNYPKKKEAKSKPAKKKPASPK
ncbi:MAG: hypothetical protein JSS70_00230 [Bacteroidetes bacterium]|nr:hypothetical protein [Bacteroidota bacterium]